MRVALVTVYSHDRCTLKDVAGGYGTVFEIGRSPLARVLEKAKRGLARLPSPILGYVARRASDAGHQVVVSDVVWSPDARTPLPSCELAIVLTSLVDAEAEADVMRALRARGVFVIAIGAYATAKPERFLENADVVVRGEPEGVGDALFDTSAKGIVEVGFIEDLDSVPSPDWRAFPVAAYRYALLSSQAPTLPVQGSRGCAYGCDYCPFRASSPFRQREPRAVVAEVRALKRDFGARGIAFRDPLFNLDRARVIELARGLAPLDVRFSAEMRADRVDEDMLDALSRAGLRSLELGVESVDTAMLDAHKRNAPEREVIERVIGWAHARRIRVIANFMFGLPEDDEARIRRTVAWAKRLNTFAVQFTVATPYPGTTLARATARHLRVLDTSRHTGWEPTFDHASLSAEKLRSLREWAYVSYHFRPRYAARFASQAVRAFLD